MPSFVVTSVRAVLAERLGLQRVDLANGRRAYVLTELLGPVSVGDDVVVNTTAVDLGLGTGGWDVVHWNLTRTDGWSQPGPGHIMKLRYTSLQTDTGAAEEGSHADSTAPALDGLPVVICSLHSQLGVVAAAYRQARPDATVAYVMTDSAALPLAFSDLVAELVDKGLVNVTVSTGQAFGGMLEAVNLPSGLRVAHGRGAQVAIVAPGPGVAGTGTALGHTALEVATVIDAVALDGGAPIVAVRYSGVDERRRHRGVSHHTLTALSRAHHPALVPVPTGEHLPPVGEHDHRSFAVADPATLLAQVGVDIATMGRRVHDDPGFFRYSAAAGIAAAQL